MGIADRDLASGIPSPLAAGALAEKPGVPAAHLFCSYTLSASKLAKGI